MNREALKLALEALEDLGMKHFDNTGEVLYKETFTAIKEALAQPEQEPVGKFAKFTDGIWREVTDGSAGVLLYTTPQRTWVGLTDEEIKKWWASENGLEDCDMCKIDDFLMAVQAIEAKLKEKNT
jgi:hypothetical protein